jgi:hypothetical protein
MFRFTIRDVLWLTVVVAMGAGWWADHAAQNARSGSGQNPRRNSVAAPIGGGRSQYLNPPEQSRYSKSLT